MNRHYSALLIGMIIGLSIVLLSMTTTALAAPLVGVPIQVTQPDGTVLNCFASGDEYYNWMHDADGYTIIQDHTNGYYVYADLVNGELVPTGYIPGKVDPKSVGLEPDLNISPEKWEKTRAVFPSPAPDEGGPSGDAPTSGTVTNLVVFIRFSDESEFSTNRSVYDNMLNSTTAGYNSLIRYYQEVSYGDVTVTSNIYPTPPSTTVVSFQDTHARAYFKPYDASTNPTGYNDDTQRRDREFALLRAAIAYVNGLGQFPGGTTIDADGDGYVDSITFVVYGSPTGWNSLLWPHAWAIYTAPYPYINGKQVYNFSFQLESTINTGVLAHETFHVMGAPDLYHYYTSGTPVGGWDVMEYDANPPQHMGCYMKYKYGHWIDSIPVLTTPGTYSLNPLTSATNNCLKIDSPNSASEYFVVEYRLPGTSTFEASLPGIGMLVYRINPAYDGNADGPPDEVYIYRPGGTPSLDGNINQANFSSTVGRTEINDTTNPYSFLTGGSPGGLDLCNIGASGSTISFDFDDCTPTDPPSAFNKSSPVDTAGDQATALTLDWSTSTGAATYDYCLDAGTPDDGCDSGWVTGITASQVSLSLSPSTTYEWQVRAINVIGTTYANNNPASYWTFTTGLSGDIYEDDDNYGDANLITSGVPQDHSIDPVGDDDWVTFTLTEESAVTLLTDGELYDDTRLYLYDDSGSGLIEYDDDDAAVDYFSLIDRECEVDALPAGTYYAMVDEYNDNNLISSYSLSFTASTCTGEFIYMPVILKPLPLPAAFGKTSPANLATGVVVNPTLNWADSSGASSYEYCIDASVNGSCTGTWTTTGSTSQVSLASLPNNTTHEWQVRAMNADGATTYADGGTLWRFTTIAVASGWTTIMSENFETAIPKTGWIRDDQSTTDGGQYVIGQRNCNVRSGSYSGWLVGGGTNGNALGCGASYKNYHNSWFVYGPFSTAGATAAELKYDFYVKSEVNYDNFWAMASSDGSNFYGYYYSGAWPWQPATLNLAGNLCAGGTASCLGRPSVYIAFRFDSDLSNTDIYGAIIDNIVLRTCNSGSCPSASQATGEQTLGSEALQDFFEPFLTRSYGFGSQKLSE
jgi:M6 family metalloprotease-like protein